MVPICVDGTDTLYYTEMGVRTVAARLEDGEIAAQEELSGFEGDGVAVFWAASPDQSKLSGSIWVEGASTAAAIYDIASQEYRTVPFERAVPLGSAINRWLSDSRRLLLALEERLMILDTESLELRPVGGVPATPVRLVDVSSDDREILLLRPYSNDDIWLIELGNERADL